MLVPPQSWMKGMVATADGPDTKSRVRTVVQRLFPHAEVVGSKGGFKDGRADALMMAYFASLKDGGTGEPTPAIQRKKSRRRS